MWKPDLTESLITLRAAIDSGAFHFARYSDCRYTQPCVIGYLMPPALRTALTTRPLGQTTADHQPIGVVAAYCQDLMRLDGKTIEVFGRLQRINDRTKESALKQAEARAVIDEYLNPTQVTGTELSEGE